MKISIIGGGYVGLVSSVCFAELGHSVNIIEAEDEKVESINSGRSQIFEKSTEASRLERAHSKLPVAALDMLRYLR